MMTRTHNTAIFAPVYHRPSSLLDVMATVYATWRQRQALSTLEAHMLDDIGVTDAMAVKEVARPFWDIPSHWRR